MTKPATPTPRFGAGGRPSLVNWLIGRRRLVLALAAVLFLWSGHRTALTYANLRSELDELLPASAPSVGALAVARQRLPGLRHLGVVVDIGDPARADAALAFVEDLEARVRAYPKELVSAVRSGVAAERRFLETHALSLMDPADVRELRTAVEARRDWQVARASGASLFESDEDPPPPLPFEKLRAKYETRHGAAHGFPDDRFISQDRKTAVLVIQAGGSGTDHAADELLLERVKGDVSALGFPANYAPDMKLGYAGDIATRVEEAEALETDLGVSSAIVVLLVLGSIVWFFRSWIAVPVLGLPLLLGTTLAFGLAALPPLGIRHLNSNTAFLASIVVGNGINSGIVMLARIRESLVRGSPLESAITIGIRETWKPTLAAAIAASAAYGSLVFTDFRGFSQFGWIGGIGLLTCWLSTLLLLPLLVSLTGDALRPTEENPWALGALVGKLVLRSPRAVLGLTLLMLIVSVVGLVRRNENWLETDFSRLRRADSWVSGERYWAQRMDATLNRYLTPTVILASDAGHARAIADRAEGLRREGAAGNLIASIRTSDQPLPPNRAEALREARELRRVITPRLEQELPQAERRWVKVALSERSLQPIAPADVPDVLAAGLRDLEGRLDRNIVIFPKVDGGTWDATRMAAYTRDLRAAASAVDPHAMVTGPILLSSDIVAGIRADGPRATGIALGVVLLVALVTFRGSLALSLASITSLGLGVALMLGFVAWSSQRLNFCNFVALPITFGIGADYSINVLKRLQAGGSGALDAAVSRTGAAVALCSVTTIIGFGSLLVAQNQALFSFGVLAVAGEFACLATAVIALPALLAIGAGRLRRNTKLAHSASPVRMVTRP